MKCFKHVALGIFAGLGLMATNQSAHAATIVAISGQTLQSFISSGDEGQVGNLLFTFSASSSIGGAPDASAITVNVAAPIAGEAGGITFNANWTPGPGQDFDTSITYTVTTVSGAAILSDDYLSVAGSLSGTPGQWLVAETIATPPGATLGALQIGSIAYVNPVVATFAPVASLTIHKDINVAYASYITGVTQAFSVPQPTAVFGGASLLGILGVIRGRNHRRERAVM
jgi:hypothetical protein